VIRGKQRDKFEDVWLECAGTLEGWTPIGARGEYEFVRVDLQRDGGPGQAFGNKVCQTGLQRMKSDGPFTATIWGWRSRRATRIPAAWRCESSSTRRYSRSSDRRLVSDDVVARVVRGAAGTPARPSRFSSLVTPTSGSSPPRVVRRASHVVRWMSSAWADDRKSAYRGRCAHW